MVKYMKYSTPPGHQGCPAWSWWLLSDGWGGGWLSAGVWCPAPAWWRHKCRHLSLVAPFLAGNRSGAAARPFCLHSTTEWHQSISVNFQRSNICSYFFSYNLYKVIVGVLIIFFMLIMSGVLPIAILPNILALLVLGPDLAILSDIPTRIMFDD